VFIARKFDGALELPPRVLDLGAQAFGASKDHALGDFQALSGHIAGLYEERETSKALREVMRLADLANQFVDEQKPWELSKLPGAEKRLQHVCSIAINLFRLLTLYLKPVVPHLAARAERFLNIPPLAWTDAGSVLANGHRIGAYQHLLTRVEEKQLDALFEPPAAQAVPQTATPQRHAEHQQHSAQKGTPVSEHISIEDFARIDLRVARIVDAEHVEGADKLLKLTLDIGTETRTVFAGVKSAYAPESLKGRYTVMVANLAPRKMRFGVSEGMVLAASSDSVGKGGGQEIFLVAADPGAQPGMRVK
jgi:methionyl-tRNA synthetase